MISFVSAGEYSYDSWETEHMCLPVVRRFSHFFTRHLRRFSKKRNAIFTLGIRKQVIFRGKVNFQTPGKRLNRTLLQVI